MKLLKKFSFWLVLIYVLIIIYNLTGLDSKNFLLFFTSPPFWITETYWFVTTFTHPSNISIYLIYITTIIFWFIVGFIIDKIIKKTRKKKRILPRTLRTLQT